LEKLAVHFCAAALELKNAGQCDHSLTLSMLKSYLTAGGPGNEDHCHTLRVLNCKLDNELLAIGHMDKTQADAHMVTKKLTYKDINAAATKACPKQFDCAEWLPAKHLPDSKAPPQLMGTEPTLRKLTRSGAALRLRFSP
jgi:hypothetical protein